MNTTTRFLQASTLSLAVMLATYTPAIAAAKTPASKAPISPIANWKLPSWPGAMHLFWLSFYFPPFEAPRLPKDKKAALDKEKKNLLSVNPPDPFALYELSNSYSDYGLFSDAQKILEKAEKAKAPTPILAMIAHNRGMIFFQQKQFSQAIPFLEKAFKLGGGEQAMISAESLSLARYLNGQLIPARMAAIEAIKLYPEQTIAHKILGLTYEAEKNEDQARRAYEGGLQQKTPDPLLQYRLGLLYFHNQEVDKGIELLREALVSLGSSPLEADLHNDLTEMLIASGQANEAEVQARAALQRNPQNVRAYYYLGQIYEGRKNPFLAVIEYRKATKQTGKDHYRALAYTALARAAWRSGDQLQAQQAISEAIKISPKLSEARYIQAMIWALTGKAKESLAGFDQTLLEMPQHVGALTYQGWAYLSLGQPAEAEARFARALAIDPMFAPAYAGQGAIAAEKADWPIAVRSYTQAIRFAPREPEYQLRLAGVYEKMSKFEDAIRVYRDLISLQSKLTVAHYRYAELLRQLGRNSEAKGEYQAYLARDPKGEYAETVKALLGTL